MSDGVVAMTINLTGNFLMITIQYNMVLLVSSSNMSLFDITNYLVSKSFTNLRMLLSSSVLTLNVGTRLI